MHDMNVIRELERSQSPQEGGVLNLWPNATGTRQALSLGDVSELCIVLVFQDYQRCTFPVSRLLLAGSVPFVILAKMASVSLVSKGSLGYQDSRLLAS